MSDLLSVERYRLVGALILALLSGFFAGMNAQAAGVLLVDNRHQDTPVSVIRAYKGPQLVMFYESGCPYCRLWEEQVGIIYDSTDEGRFAPLRRVVYWKAHQLGLRDIIYTPTFVVFDKGREIGRITGYPGEQMLWPMLDDILAKVGYGQKPKPAPEKAA